MATKVKPTRLQISGTPQAGQVPVYVDDNCFCWGSGGTGNVEGPSSSCDGDVAIFCGTCGDCIVDSGEKLCDYAKQCDLTNLAQCCDIPTDNCQLTNGCGYTTCTGTVVDSDLACYVQCCDMPDMSCYQQVCNMVCNLTGADNNHYPSAKAVADALSCAGAGDMLKSVYDPNNHSADAFDYCNFTNTPTIPTDNCQLANGCGYTTCTGTLQSCDIACVNGCCLTNGGNITISGGADYSWCTQTISGGNVTLCLRTIVNVPTSDFTLVKPATLIDGEEYAIRVISETSYCMCLGSCFTNPRNVDTTLSGNATDQYVFLSIGGELELQPLVDTGN